MVLFPPIDPTLCRPEPRFPRDREPNRPLRSAIRHLQQDDGDHDRRWCWGFTVFRTVYTVESNDTFPKAMERLDTYAKLFADDDILVRWPSEEPKDTRLNQEIYDRWYNDIIEDPETLDGASPDEVGKRFDAWVAEHVRKLPEWNGRFKVCLMIDQESLDQIMMLPGNPRPNSDIRVRNQRDPNMRDRWVKVVSDWQQPEGGRFWLRVGVCGRLFKLWFTRWGEKHISDFGVIDEGDPIPNHWGKDLYR